MTHETRDAASLLHEALRCHRQGRLEDAEGLYRRILATDEANFEGLFYLGQVLAALDRYEEAYEIMHRASSVRPDSVEAYYHLGAILIALRRPHQAQDYFQKALQLNPRHARALDGLGMALFAADRAKEAVPWLRAAIEADPALGDAQYNLGIVLCALDRPEAAVEALERALDLQPERARTLNALSAALNQCGRLDEATERLRQALALAPDMPEGHANLGAIELQNGNLDAARQAFRRALQLRPRSARIHSLLASVDRMTPGDPRLADLESFLPEVESLPKADRIVLHFALGSAYEDLGEHERSFEHRLRGNALKRTLIDYDEKSLLDDFARTALVLDRPFMEARRDWGDPTNVPVFIVGMPRSGTTLIEQILASHPDVHAAGELSDFQRLAHKVLGANGRPIDTDTMRAATKESIRELGAQYLETIRSLSPTASKITDKLPANAIWVGLIHLALPNARIIRALRDPVDTCLSCFSIGFRTGQNFTYDLSELGRYYVAYQRLMDHWESVVPKDALLEVRYENVVADFEAQARRIVEFCGLTWNELCLEFYKTQRPVKTASWTQVRKPIYGTSVGRWKPFESRLGPLLKALDYKDS